VQIVVKGRNLPVTDDMRELVARRFDKIGKQVSEAATLEVELCEAPTQAASGSCVAEATLYLKGVSLRAKDASPDMAHSVSLVADELGVQVKRHRDKRRKRREARAPAPAWQPPAA
jgi:putative sigma-54 modulation protein